MEVKDGLILKTILQRDRFVYDWHLSRYVTSHPSQLSLAVPSWVSAMSTSQRAVMPCGWNLSVSSPFFLITCAAKNRGERLCFRVVRPAIRASVRFPLTPISRDTISAYFVDGFQSNVVQTFNTWVAIAEGFRDQRSKVEVISQLLNLCTGIHRICMWVRSVSRCHRPWNSRKIRCSLFLFSVKNAKIVQPWVLT